MNTTIPNMLHKTIDKASIDQTKADILSSIEADEADSPPRSGWTVNKESGWYSAFYKNRGRETIKIYGRFDDPAADKITADNVSFISITEPAILNQFNTLDIGKIEFVEDANYGDLFKLYHPQDMQHAFLTFSYGSRSKAVPIYGANREIDHFEHGTTQVIMYILDENINANRNANERVSEEDIFKLYGDVPSQSLAYLKDFTESRASNSLSAENRQEIEQSATNLEEQVSSISSIVKLRER